MGAIRGTTCRICGAPREEGSPDLLCLEHRRERDRLRRREELGIPLDLPAPKKRKFPRGQCQECGEKVHAQGLCEQHLREYKRRWAAARRLKLGVQPRAPRLGLSGGSGMVGADCRTPRCNGKVSTEYGTLCDVCKRESDLRRGASVQRAKRRTVKAKAPAYIPKTRLEQPDIAIGPEAFAKPEPVSVEGREVVRVRVPFEVIEAAEREREWAEWFAARGL